VRGFVGRSLGGTRPSGLRPGRSSIASSWSLRALGLAKLRALVMLLVLPIALSWSLPALARVVAGPPAHVCHCDMRHGHATCACPKCFPDRERDDLAFSEESLRGQCGDDNAPLRESRCLDAGVLRAPWLLAPAAIDVVPEPLVSAELRSLERSPPRRPPKIAARV
jgi:hypothetical protein